MYHPLGGYLRDVLQLQRGAKNFRIMCPDELESHRLGAVLEVTDRQYVWPLPEGTEHRSREGRGMEVLSEHNCQDGCRAIS
jgi:xylulose-5-phosphate/fructose-6-phosphate phosphoketolase